VATLLQSVERLFADLPDAVRLTGRDGKLLYRNAAALTLPAEGFGHLCGGKGGKSSCPACLAVEVIDKGTFHRWHLAHSPSEDPGVQDYYEVTLCPIREQDGRVCAVLEILRDETANLGLQHYLINRSERQDSQLHRQSQESERLAHETDTLQSELGTLKDTQAEVLYRDRLSALGQVVAGLAHEMHTPLGAVLSSTDLIQSRLARLADGVDPQAVDERGRPLRDRLRALGESADVVSEGARRIHAVLRALLNFARLDEAPLKTVDLREGLDSTVKLLQYRMGDRIKLIRRYGDLRPLRCRPDALNQVFMNLLVNAVQSIPESGEITVETEAADDHAVVRIRDTGVGIPEDVAERIFDLGFTTRGKARGSGLGLALCRRIIDDHQGTIEVDSRPGEGAVFTIRLPFPGTGDGT